MILKYVIMMPDGRYPRSCSASAEEPEDAILAPQDILPMQLARMQLVEEVWIERPEAVMDLSPTGAVFLNVPVGSSVDVIDEAVGASIGTATDDENGDIIIDLPDAGLYRLEGSYPLPWLPTTHRVIR